MSISSVGSMDYHKSSDRIPVKRPNKKKPKDKPKRPLSAYNFFFKTERGKILAVLAELDGENKDELPVADGPPMANKEVLNDPSDPDYLDDETIGRLRKEGGKVSFEVIGKIIGQRWKNIDPDRLQKFSELAAEDTDRYKKEMLLYNGRQEEKMRVEAMKPPAPTYTEMQMKSQGGSACYSDSSMGYGAVNGGGYYGYHEAYQYQYPSSAMYQYSYPSESMSQQPMGGSSDARVQQQLQQQQYAAGQNSSGYYGAPPGYPMGYGSGAGDGYGPPPTQPPNGSDYYGSGYGHWGQQ
ncbi:hypothetical protein MPSEU_000703800 [Mayamaea pseudoterrestris]|nr:hypothetical protein MPSEU_000703800 [Mayamaea pseudoterrestris]